MSCPGHPDVIEYVSESKLTCSFLPISCLWSPGAHGLPLGLEVLPEVQNNTVLCQGLQLGLTVRLFGMHSKFTESFKPLPVGQGYLGLWKNGSLGIYAIDEDSSG